MNRTRGLRYGLFSVCFALTIAAVLVRPLVGLILCIVIAVILGSIGEWIETAPTRAYKKYNALHHRLLH